jgi:hypothetical protein
MAVASLGAGLANLPEVLVGHMVRAVADARATVFLALKASAKK